MQRKIILLLASLFFVLTIFCQQRADIKDLELQTKFLESRKEIEEGKLDKGISILEELYRDYRTDAGLNHELAKAYSKKKDFLSVEKYGANAIKYSPNNEWYQLFYGQYMLENNRPETALSSFQKLTELQPKNPDYYQYKADALIALNKVEEAAKVYDDLELQIGKGADIMLSRFDIWDNAQREAEALNELNQLIVTYPENKNYLKIKAGYLNKMGRETEAGAVYKAVLDLDPNDVEANVAMLDENLLNEKSDAYLRALLPIVGDPNVEIDTKIKELLPYIKNLVKGEDTQLTDALKEIGNRLILTHPEDAKAHSLFGDILVNSGDPSKAASEYEKALSLDNRNFAIWEQLMYIYYDLSEFDRLKKLAEEAIDFYPNQSISFFFASMTSIRAGNSVEAVSLSEEGLFIASTNKVASSMLNTSLAAAYLAQNELDRATEVILKALALSDDKNGFALELRGDILAAKNDKIEALSYWKKAMDAGINSKRLAIKINGQSN